MSSLLVTTVASVKEILTQASTSKDDLIGDLIARVSRQFEQYMQRDFEAVEREEDHDLTAFTQATFLSHTPVDLAETFEIRLDAARDFTGDAIDVDGYSIKPATGRLVVDRHASSVVGFGVMRVKYTGGFAADSAGLQSGYPDIEHAGRQQVAYMLQRAHDPGSTTTTSGAGQRTFVQELKLLASVREVLDAYRRRV